MAQFRKERELGSTGFNFTSRSTVTPERGHFQVRSTTVARRNLLGRTSSTKGQEDERCDHQRDRKTNILTSIDPNKDRHAEWNHGFTFKITAHSNARTSLWYVANELRYTQRKQKECKRDNDCNYSRNNAVSNIRGRCRVNNRFAACDSGRSLLCVQAMLLLRIIFCKKKHGKR